VRGILFALLALPASAAAPAVDVEKAFARISALLAAQRGQHAGDIDALDKLALAEEAGFKRHGWRAVEPLAAVASDLKRPMKERLFAASFLARTGDPLAAAALEEILLDSKQDPLVRGSAAESLAALPITRATARRILTAALADPALPREVLEPVLAKAALTGLSDAETGRLVLRRLGARPEGRAREAARLAAAALGRTYGAGAVDALLDLLRWYPADSALRGDVVAALAAKRRDLLTFRRAQARPALEEALRSETAHPARMVLLSRLGADYGPELAPALARLARHPDAEVLVEAAEGLARVKDREAARRALPEFEAVVAGALSDPRFSPKDGRPDPAALLGRLERAVAALKPVSSLPER
jgi:hypothetical protein